MPKGKPTPAQAQLVLQLYDLRREAKLRQAREWFVQNYNVKTVEAANRLTPPGSQENAYVRMTVSYWEQACALLNYGLLHEELFFETTGEFFVVWESIKPLVPQWRKLYKDPHMAEHLEKAASRYAKWSERRAPGHLDAVRGFIEQMRATAAAPRSA